MLEAIQLKKQFNGYPALKGIDLLVKPGEIYCLLGANGAGKSTTINIFLNFLTPDGGQAMVNGLDVTAHQATIRRAIAYIPENLMLYPHLSGIENLDFFCRMSEKKYPMSALIKFLTEAGLQEDAIHKRVSGYSKGMRQKVGIALAVAKDAKVLLLDEPTSGLDPKASNEFSSLLLTMKSKGVATLMATHDLFRSKETGTHIGIMKQGELVVSMESSAVTFNDLEKLYLQHMHN